MICAHHLLKEYSMIVSAVSMFHDCLSQSFRVPSRAGRYYRFAPHPHPSRLVGCQCGFPVLHTLCHVSVYGYSARVEWAPPGSGRDNVVVVVEDDCNA